MRSLVAGLETVKAPADFDFRLRARLAREKDSASGTFSVDAWWTRVRPIAAAAMVLLIVVGGIVIKNRLSVTPPIAQGGPTQIQNEIKGAKAPVVKETEAEHHRVEAIANALVTSTDDRTKPQGTGASPEKKRLRAMNPAAGRKDRLATREDAVSPASVLERNAPAEFAIQLDAQPMKLSIVNGRGDKQTISLPLVTFGSQHLLRSASFAPASDSKGGW